MDSGKKQHEQRRYKVNLHSRDPYAVLGLDVGASPRAIKRAYFSLVREYPPERKPAEFKLLRAAYEVLRDPAKRAQVDLFRLQLPDPWQARKQQQAFQLAFDPQDVVRFLQAQVTHGDVMSDFRPIKLK